MIPPISYLKLDLHLPFQTQNLKIITPKQNLLLFPQSSQIPLGYISSRNTQSKTGSLKMIINIDPSYRVSVGWCWGSWGPHASWMLIESMSFRAVRMDGAVCVSSVSSDKAGEITQPGRRVSLIISTRSILASPLSSYVSTFLTQRWTCEL